jgi:hypothetical protein
VEGGNPIAYLELSDFIANSMDYTGNIIALVHSRIHPLRCLPVLGVTARNNNSNDELARMGDLRNGNVLDGDRRARCNDCFLHDEVARGAGCLNFEI